MFLLKHRRFLVLLKGFLLASGIILFTNSLTTRFYVCSSPASPRLLASRGPGMILHTRHFGSPAGSQKALFSVDRRYQLTAIAGFPVPVFQVASRISHTASDYANPPESPVCNPTPIKLLRGPPVC